MSHFPVTIFHNPACGTSRKVLAAIREAGHEPNVVLYLETGWTRTQLKDLLKALNLRPVELLRKKNSPAAELVEELKLLDADTTDEEILEAMILHPVLVERPIVVTLKGTKLCRPAETVQELL